MTDLERGYLAGILDGEGSISFRATKGRAEWSVRVTSTSPGLLLWLQERWGGNIWKAQSTTVRQKPAHQWTIYGRRAVEVCSEVAPLLVVKRAQAELLIESFALYHGRRGRGHRVGEQATNDRLAVHARFRILNHRGVDAAI